MFVLDAAVWLVSLFSGRDPDRLRDACDRVGLDTDREDVRDAVIARAML